MANKPETLGLDQLLFQDKFSWFFYLHYQFKYRNLGLNVPLERQSNYQAYQVIAKTPPGALEMLQ